MTHHAVVDAAKDLLEKAQAGDPIVLGDLKKSAVWFVPVVNPDGLNYVFESDRMWRKNRSKNSNGTRGVDLNRNYEFKWGECGRNSSSPSSQVFKGPAAFSETESRTLDQLNARLRAQYLISYHSFGNEVLYPYVCGRVTEPNYMTLRDELVTELNYGERLASSSGEDFEHHYARYGSLSFLLEIGSTFQPRFSHYRNVIWPKVKKVVPFLLNKLSEPHVEIRVQDLETKEPLQAAVEVDQLRFTEGEIRTTDSFGVYRWRLPAGDYQFDISLNGYKTNRTELSFAGREKRVLTIELEKE